jgi:hypothetical protein
MSGAIRALDGGEDDGLAETLQTFFTFVAGRFCAARNGSRTFPTGSARIISTPVAKLS